MVAFLLHIIVEERNMDQRHDVGVSTVLHNPHYLLLKVYSRYQTPAAAATLPVIEFSFK